MNKMKRIFMRIRLLWITDGYKKANYLKKKEYFSRQGVHCYLQPNKYGTEPHLISLGDNVHIASDVSFINHDITNKMLSYMFNVEFSERVGKIEIGNNVFVGANSTLLYNIKIGNNVIIGANTLVNKNIPHNTVVAGVPAKIIGTFDEFVSKSKIYTDKVSWKLNDSKNEQIIKQKEYFKILEDTRKNGDIKRDE